MQEKDKSTQTSKALTNEPRTAKKQVLLSGCGWQNLNDMKGKRLRKVHINELVYSYVQDVSEIRVYKDGQVWLILNGAHKPSEVKSAIISKSNKQ